MSSSAGSSGSDTVSPTPRGIQLVCMSATCPNLAHLNEFEAIVEQETPVTMAMLLDPAKTPPEMESNEILQVIRDYMKNSTKVWMPEYGQGNQ